MTPSHYEGTGRVGREWDLDGGGDDSGSFLSPYSLHPLDRALVRGPPLPHPSGTPEGKMV